MTEETTPAATDAATPPTDNDQHTATENIAPADIGADIDAAEAAKPRHSFDSMELGAEIRRALDEMGYDEPTDVQHAVFEDVLAGNDVMVQARTGTGKTAAFGIPIVEMLSADEPGVQALILAPTRELALQVSMELSHIGQHKGIKVVPVYGGAPMGKQIDALKAGAQVVAGTPGRVLDHIGRGTLKTSKIRKLVLDECDEMLSMGFQEEIEKIISTLPPKEERQTLLFSATIPQDIERIARRHMTEPRDISLSSDDDISVDQIDHSYYVVSGMARTRDLMKVLEVEKPTSAIVFCNTREDTNTVASYLRKHGFDAEAISSDLSQRDRERVMKRMRDKNLHYLVATDVAARGIDISDLSHVINYTFPESPEVYVHRTGRTGRAGNKGVAISLVGPREIGSFYYLKLLYKIRPRERMLPSATEMAALREGERYESVLSKVKQEPKAEYRALARRLWQSPEGERVVGALLQELLEAPEPVAPQPARKAVETEDETNEHEPQAEAAEPAREARDDERGGRSRRRTRNERSERGERGERSERGRRGRRSRTRDESRDEVSEAAPVESAEAAEQPAVEPPAVESAEAAEQPATEVAESAEKTPLTDPAPAAESEAPQPIETRGEQASETSDTGDKPRKKRRRRRGTRGESEAPRKRDAGDTREFWEAWADEKTTDAGSDPAGGSDEAADDDGDDDVRLYVNLGRREEIDAETLRALLAEGMEADDAAQLGKVQVRNTHCYIRVPAELADKVIDAAQGKSFKDREVQVELAKR